MTHSKRLTFVRCHVIFEVTVTYEDVPFIRVFDDPCAVFYHVVLHQPVSIDYGTVYFPKPHGFSAMLWRRGGSFYNLHYGLKEDARIAEWDHQVNLYPRVVDLVTYRYFDGKRITHYERKVFQTQKALEEKYDRKIEPYRVKRRALRKRLRTGEIDSKAYQRLYRPIRLAKAAIESKLTWAKYHYKKRYFKCGRLKDHYRTPEGKTCLQEP